MTKRKVIDFGMNPIIGFILFIAVFIGFSIYLFFKTEFAQYVYLLIALSFVFKLSERKRNDFLKSIFLNNLYWKIRLIENFILILPFVVFLVYKQSFYSVLILTFLALAIALFNFNDSYNFTIPTPFYKKPFEFIVGFRSAFYMFFIAYFLTFMAVAVSNLNLGIFAMLLVFLVSFSFFLKPENEYYVWIFNKSPNGFLLEKFKTAILYSSFVSVPIFGALGFYFSSEIVTLLVFMLLGYVYLITIVLAKYSSYPYEMNLPQAFLLGISLLFPPLLIGIIPLFYLQSMKRLNDILK